jgi:bifunctional enzyme CysN/CysC
MERIDALPIVAFLEAQRDKPTLRFITCGSVDDGKSTLIGRLLHDTKNLFDDQLRALESESKQYGTQGETLDLALLVDGLQAEREQGITIDVAYRFFSTEKRRYVVADTPGHEQYTRNMATGASTADVAVILVDARKGILTQTRRHARIVSMMGIAHVALAINKMDLVGFSEETFRRFVEDFRAATVGFGFRTVQPIPTAALAGDNVILQSARMPWYKGPTLLEFLEELPLGAEAKAGAFRLPVQWVNRPSSDFRGFCGRIAHGTVRPGDEVRVLPAGTTARVARIVTFDGDLPQAQAGESITLTLDAEVDVSRGNVLVAPGAPLAVADQARARLLWMAEGALVPGRSYWLKLHHQEVSATVTTLHHRVDVNTGEETPATALACNEIGVVSLRTARPLVFEPYAHSRVLGGFILIDRLTFETVAAGMIDDAVREGRERGASDNEIRKDSRAALKGQKARCVWLQGGTDEGAWARRLESRLHAEGFHTMVLEGNRFGGLGDQAAGPSGEPRTALKRLVEAAKLLVEAGLVVLVESPRLSLEELAYVRLGWDHGEFVEVASEQEANFERVRSLLVL